ncbi:MAG: C40 family peptidase [bacterium]|nr:C40 family peptidase [bacterium]
MNRLAAIFALFQFPAQSQRTAPGRARGRRFAFALAAVSAGLLIGAGALQAGAHERPTERRLTRYDGKGIVQLAQKYLGTPYRYGGNSPAGFDCSGFTSYVYKKAGYRLPRATTGQYGKMNAVRAPKIGDLVFFRTSGKRISHVGIYVGNYQFIHAPSSGKTVSYADIRNSYWKPRYAGSRTIFRRGDS